MFVWRFFRETKVVRIKVGALKECAGMFNISSAENGLRYEFWKTQSRPVFTLKILPLTDWPASDMCASPLDTRRPFDIFEIQIKLSDGAACIFEDAYLTNFSKFRNLVSQEGSRAKKIFDFHGSGSRSVLFAVLTTVVASALSSVSNPFDGDDDDEDIEESRVESGQWRDVHAPIAW